MTIGPRVPTTKGPPTKEIGQEIPSAFGTPGWGYFAGDDLERAPELIWPQAVKTYHMMRNDSQVDGLWSGSALPIRRYRWSIDPMGARSVVAKGVADDLGLPLIGQDPKPRRRKGRFSWDSHLYHALLAMLYGHMFFEQVGEIGDDGLWHLKKLAPRMPQTIFEFRLAEDGGLVWIKQNVGWQAPPIPVERLVGYVWDKEGPNWLGRSMLRPIYKNWLIKDRLLRIDAINHERAGGTPWIEAPEGASNEQIKQLANWASQFKVGEGSGGAIPHGAVMNMTAPPRSGTTAVDSLRFHNEEMARSWLMMFMQLGQTQTGSRALGAEFIDFFAIAQESIATWIADVTNEHVIEDWVDWNYGEDEEAPQLVFDNDEAGSVAIADLASLIDKGVVEVDDNLREMIRDRFRLPEPVPEEEQPPTPTPPPPPAPGEPVPPQPSEPATAPVEPSSTPPAASQRRTERQRRTRAAGDGATSPIALPPRPLRRQPYAQEIRAQVDFASMDSSFNSARDKLVLAVSNEQGPMIQELHDLIIEAKGNVKKLAELSATPVHADTLEAAFVEMAGLGAHQAVGEATRQGAKLSIPDLEALGPSLRARAEATDAVLARSLSEGAARKAMALTGGALDDAAVADAVEGYLAGLTNAFLQDQLGGALTSAMNAGRKTVMDEGKPSSIYSSELLDDSTCDECVSIDGTEYQDLDAAEQDYPTGGYMDCAGGPRCRGTLIAIYGEEPEEAGL